MFSYVSPVRAYRTLAQFYFLPVAKEAVSWLNISSGNA
jgi:hypothetical protein